MIDLYIETLTGTAFELRVSQFETIISVKNKIQRLEGIPIGQQHLIWQSVELDDDFCLHDYDIPNGATLRLVLAMRGGPINTRRVPMEESYVEYVESTPDGDMGSSDQLSGSRQFTVVVIREGDQCNIFRVVDRADGALTPLSESLSATSMHNLHDEEEEDDGMSRERNEENARIKEKITDLRSKMECMHINKKSKKITPSAPPAGRPISSTRLQALRTNHLKSAQTLNKTPCLPPLSSTKSLNQTSTDSTSNEPNIPLLPSENKHKIDEKKPQSIAPPLNPPVAMLAEIGTSAIEQPRSYSGKLLPSRSLRKRDSDKPSLFSDRCPIQTSIPEDEAHACCFSPTHSKNIDISDQTIESPSKELNSKIPKPLHSSKMYSSNDNRSLTETRSVSRQRDFMLEGLKESLSSQRIALQSINLSKADAKKMTGILNQASIEPASINIGSFSPLRMRRGNSRTIDIDSHTEELPSRDLSGNIMRPVRTHDEDLEPITSSSAKLPPVKSKKKTSRRCFVCTKKTGLATSYPCRCGNNFCAVHRYAEAHNCTYDYKTEGRKILEQSNPVVSAPKLPKI